MSTDRNPEAAAPTDMETALREANAWLTSDPTSTLMRPNITRLARCLLASSAEVAALREQVATARVDERMEFADKVNAIAHRMHEECEWLGECGREKDAPPCHSCVQLARLAGEVRGLADPGALPKSGAADEREGAACEHESSHAITPNSSRFRRCDHCGYEFAEPPHSGRLLHASPLAAPSSEPVERDPDDDGAWPLPEPWMRWKKHDDGDWFVHVKGLDHDHAGECAFMPQRDGWPGSLGEAFPALLPIIASRNAARAARTKAAATKDASHG